MPAKAQMEFSTAETCASLTADVCALAQISRTLTLVPRLAVAGMAALNVFNLMDMILVGMGVEVLFFRFT